MILVDSNLLLYSSLSVSAHHSQAKEWLDGQLGGIERVGIPWVSLTAFLRISTNPRLFEQPLEAAAAWQQVTDWLNCSVVWIPEPTQRHTEILGELIKSSNPTANLMTDAHIAAIAIGHGLTVCSADSDFAKFKGLRWHNPLA